jgi:hypothetical protein
VAAALRTACRILQHVRNLSMSVALVLAFTIAGCAADDNGYPPSTIVAQPSSVPAVAELVESEVSIGAGEAGSDERRLAGMTCSEGLMTVATTRETIYAELPCDRFATPEIIDRFRDVAIRVTVRPAEGEGKLIIESETRASLEFTIGHAWLEEP